MKRQGSEARDPRHESRKVPRHLVDMAVIDLSRSNSESADVPNSRPSSASDRRRRRDSQSVSAPVTPPEHARRHSDVTNDALCEILREIRVTNELLRALLNFHDVETAI